MAAGRADLLFDQIEIVQQPFVGRRHPPVGRHRGHDQLIGFEQNRFVLLQATQQSVWSGPLVHLMPTGQCFRVLLELVRAE